MCVCELSLGEAVSGAWDEAKQLWDGIEKVEYLWDEKEQHCLAEVGQNPHHGERHSGEIAERITDKHSRWVPVREADI